MLSNTKSVMTEEIIALYDEGISPSEIINIIAERWNEKTFVVSYIVELTLNEDT